MKTLTASERLAEAETAVARLREEARAEAIRSIQAQIDAFRLGPRDLQWPKNKQPRAEVRENDGRSVVPVRYKDPVTDVGWSGRGTVPKWLMAYIESGRDRDEFLTPAGREAMSAQKKVSGTAPTSAAPPPAAPLRSGSAPAPVPEAVAVDAVPDADTEHDDDDESAGRPSSPGMS